MRGEQGTNAHFIGNIFDSYPDVVTVAQLQEMLSIGRNTAYDLLNANKIRSIRIGKVHRIPKVNVINYLQVECN